MPRNIGQSHPLRRFFAGLVEQVFMTEVGLADPRLTDYLTRLLSEFVHIDRIYRMRTIDGETIRDVSRIEAEAYLGPGLEGTARTWLVNRYIGDFTLFWIGVYPESLRPRHAGVDRLQEFRLQGKRSYGIASELTPKRADPPGSLLRQLSEEFEACAHGLSLVRAGWERLDADLNIN